VKCFFFSSLSSLNIFYSLQNALAFANKDGDCFLGERSIGHYMGARGYEISLGVLEKYSLNWSAF